MIARVLIDNLSIAGDSIYDYIVPKKIEDQIQVGKRVLVYFGRGNNLIPALVIRLCEKSDVSLDKLKEVDSVIDAEPIVKEYLIRLALFMREEFFCTYAQSLSPILPSMEHVIKKEYFSLCDDVCNDPNDNFEDDEILFLIEQRKGKATIEYLSKKTSVPKKEVKNIVYSYIKQNKVKSDVSFYAKSEMKKEYIMLSGKFKTIDEYLNNVRKNAIKQIAVLKAVKDFEVEYSLLKQKLNIDRATINKLLQMGLIKQEFREEEEEFLKSEKTRTYPLNEEQKSVLEMYLKSENNKFLLHGVTGSGKTLVYIHMFKEAIKKGKQCLFLVPEISLTPQMMKNIYDEFDGKVAIMHSKLSHAKRIREWEKVRKGKADVVLGARSAIFMPFKNLGLMVIDEEHENTYKSSSTPRYDTIALANYISDITGAKLVLGSATPSIESYYKAMIKKYTLLEMKHRTNKKPSPNVEIIDMANELRTGNRLPVSRKLKEEIELRLEKREQVILFLNRRGYNTFVLCPVCGYTEECPNCDVSLTYHKNINLLKCHYCGYTKQKPETCPSCGSKKINFLGKGTEKIMDQIQELFPDSRVLRLDLDTTRKKGSMENILKEFADENADILIGTQMVVKGHDFKNVTLVGIILADYALNLPDINAGQRTFQLCTQAAGRAGRSDKEGNVIMQTYKPKNKTLIFSALNNYKGFYAYEIQYRLKMDYPPFSEILGIFVSNEDEGVAIKECEKIYKKISDLVQNKKDVKIYKPTQAFIYKLQNKYTMHVLVKYKIGDEIKKRIRKEFHNFRRNMKSSVFVEINPMTLL